MLTDSRATLGKGAPVRVAKLKSATVPRILVCIVFEPHLFQQAIYAEAALLKLLGVGEIFSADMQGIDKYLFETEKRILNYFNNWRPANRRGLQALPF